MKTIITLALFVLVFTACNSDTPDTTPQEKPTLQKVEASCPTGTFNTKETIDGKKVCELRGIILNDLLLTSDIFWSIKGEVHIGHDNTQDHTLTIEEGTTLFGAKGSDLLVITRGSKINAQGSERHPIVFTSSNDIRLHKGAAGDWGGLVIAGNAPTNDLNANGNEIFEFSKLGLNFGGKDPHDSSGILRYVIIKYSGYEVAPRKELNGLSMGGVGDGTIIDYIEVYQGSDDGIELWGGSVNMKHLVLIGNQDDAFDLDHGYSGKVQYLYIRQEETRALYARGIEADNNENSPLALPKTRPTIINFEIQGSKKGKESILLRNGAAGIFRNGTVRGENRCFLGIHDQTTIENSKIDFMGIDFELNKKSRRFCGRLFVKPDMIASIFTKGKKSSEQNMDQIFDMEYEDPFFDKVDFIGAYEASKDWRKGWTVGL